MPNRNLGNDEVFLTPDVTGLLKAHADQLGRPDTVLMPANTKRGAEVGAVLGFDVAIGAVIALREQVRPVDTDAINFKELSDL